MLDWGASYYINDSLPPLAKDMVMRVYFSDHSTINSLADVKKMVGGFQKEFKNAKCAFDLESPYEQLFRMTFACDVKLILSERGFRHFFSAHFRDKRNKYAAIEETILPLLLTQREHPFLEDEWTFGAIHRLGLSNGCEVIFAFKNECDSIQAKLRIA